MIKKYGHTKYKRCKRCVMDTSDRFIQFNSQGVCNHCIKFSNYENNNWFPNEEGNRRLNTIFNRIKKNSKNKKFDCLLGLSGGIDSSYLALKVYELGLKPLVIHIDAGWNSELAVSNIESIVKYCRYELITHVVNWEEMKSLQLAYLKAGVPNQDIPQDHIFISYLYKYAVSNNIKYLLSGGNIATEGVFPDSWLWSNNDSINIKDIYKKFGDKKLKDYKITSFFEYYFLYPIFFNIKTIRPLNYMRYNKVEACRELSEKVGFKDYKRKHGESIFTSFYQNYYLPKKFGIDKRLPHLSSLINSRQLKRSDAIEILKEDLYCKDEIDFDKLYIAKKLGITVELLEEYIGNKNREHSSFKNWTKYYNLLKKTQNFLTNKFGILLNKYS